MQTNSVVVWTDIAIFLGGIGLGLLIARFWLRTATPRTAPVAPDAPDPTPRAIAQLQQTELAYQMASEMCQFQAGFLARTSHELRSPINSVISLHQLILADLCEDPEEEREYVAQANLAAQRMLAALDELITVSKVQHGRIELQIQPINLQLVLDDVHRMTHLQAKNRNLRLDIQPCDPDIYVLADPSRLRQVLIHLVDWAIDGLDEGWIRVTTDCTPPKGLAQIVIADDRPETVWAEAVDLLKTPPVKTSSVSKETIAPLNPEAHATHTSLPGGLTLFADRTLVEAMQGTLDIIPNPMGDRGYAIRCSIPLVEPEA